MLDVVGRGELEVGEQFEREERQPPPRILGPHIERGAAAQLEAADRQSEVVAVEHPGHVLDHLVGAGLGLGAAQPGRALVAQVLGRDHHMEGAADLGSKTQLVGGAEPAEHRPGGGKLLDELRQLVVDLDGQSVDLAVVVAEHAGGVGRLQSGDDGLLDAADHRAAASDR